MKTDRQTAAAAAAAAAAAVRVRALAAAATVADVAAERVVYRTTHTVPLAHVRKLHTYASTHTHSKRKHQHSHTTEAPTAQRL